MRTLRSILPIAIVWVLALAPASFATTASIGPQAMEGNLTVNPGDVVRAGISFALPGNHADTTLEFVNPVVSFANVVCTAGPGGGSFTVDLGSNGLLGPYSIPQNENAWHPTGDQSSDAAYQGSLAAPDLCNGGSMSLRNGATFSADVQADHPHTVNVRFHYSADGSSGSWSTTKGIDPDPLNQTSAPLGAAGALTASVLIGGVFFVAHRRRRTPQQAAVR